MTDTTKEMIAVMQAFADGAKIEFRNRGWASGVWLHSNPKWNWESCDYRVAVTKPSVDWSHVSDEFIGHATDSDGRVFLHSKRPDLTPDQWESNGRIHRLADADGISPFSSFRPGKRLPLSNCSLATV